jgi:thiol:disulfide interchange protein
LLVKIFFPLLLAFSFSVFAHADGGTDYKAAMALAKAQNKLVLLDFTGSDWCPSCKLLDQEVLSQPSFKKFADERYVAVILDYPQNAPQPDALARQNDALATQYNVEGFPTLIVVNADGKELGREVGYDPGSGVKAVISRLKSFK